MSSEIVALIIGTTLGAAGAFVFIKSPRNQMLTILVCALATYFLSTFSHFTTFVALLIPSVVHIYVFTGAFILFGALKGKSSSGYLSFVIFLLCPIPFFVFGPTTEGYEFLNPFVEQNIDPFMQISASLGSFLGLEENWDITMSLVRFLAFGYTYHYFNWFSKTQIIRWHEVTKQRIVLLVSIYACCVALYIFDYALGFIAVYFISLVHVFLEFPLNYRSFVGIQQELFSRTRP